MAEVTLRFAGPMRRPWAEMSRTIEIEAGSSVAEVLQQLGYNERELAFFATAINSTSVGPDTALCEGDTLDVMLKVGGG